eukprot:scaffold271879_cov30-Tisochrysis_lutea.AAC.8
MNGGKGSGKWKAPGATLDVRIPTTTTTTFVLVLESRIFKIEFSKAPTLKLALRLAARHGEGSRRHIPTNIYATATAQQGVTIGRNLVETLRNEPRATYLKLVLVYVVDAIERAAEQDSPRRETQLSRRLVHRAAACGKWAWMCATHLQRVPGW